LKSNSRTSSLGILLFGIALEAIIILFSISSEGFTLEALHVTTRFSGRLSLLAFSLILLLYDRRGVIRLDIAFLLFAVMHGIHLIELLFYVKLAGVELIPIRVFGGFIAYALIFAMPILVVKKDHGKLSVKCGSNLFYLCLAYFLHDVSSACDGYVA
jgi:hypothetical protein